MKSVMIASVVLGLAVSSAIAQNTGGSAKDFAPGQQQGPAKKYAPGQKQKQPGQAKEFAPGQMQRDDKTTGRGNKAPADGRGGSRGK
ncbi:MAG: hypothetical protein ACRECO_02020 [Xanthobacteraceae bacterium]